MSVKIEVVDVSKRRAALDPPPFIADRKLWARAVAMFKTARGRRRGEPFLLTTEIYRALGGAFR